MSDGIVPADTRLRQMKRMISAHVIHDLKRKFQFMNEKDAADIAEHATAAVFDMIYNGDAEITRLKEERDHYKSLVFQYVTLVPFTTKMPE